MPKFLIQYGENNWENITYTYKGLSYKQKDLQKLDIPNLHTYGIEDRNLHYEAHKLYTNSKVVIQYFGHDLPVKMTDENFQILKDFIKEQYVVKNGNDDGFEIPFEHFDFA